MFKLEQHARPHPDVVDTELDAGQTVILHLEKKIYYSLNPTGTRVWQGVKKCLPLGEISRKLQEEFAVEAKQANRSVLALIDELSAQQLVQMLD